MTRFQWTKTSPAILLLAGILAGCASSPPIPKANTAETAAPATQQSPQESDANNPLLALLIAEIAAQRGDYTTAIHEYITAAKAQNEPELARRGVEIGLRQNLAEPAYQAAVAWQELAPQDPLASRAVLLLQLGTNRLEEAVPNLKQYFAEIKRVEQEQPNPTGVTADKIIMEMLMRIPDKGRVYGIATEVFGNTPSDPDNQSLLAETAFYTDQVDIAIGHMQNVLNKAPSESNFLMMAAFLEKRDNNPKAAIELLSDLTQQHNDWFKIRLYLARVYTQQEQWAQAKQQFEEMLKLKPAETSMHSSLGFIYSKLGDRQQAEKHFKQYLKQTPAHERQNESLIYLTMADMALNNKDLKAALQILDTTPSAANNLDVQLKKAEIYEKQGKHKEAQKTLDNFKPLDENSAVRLVLAKSQQAETRKEPALAVKALEQGLDRYPNQPDLLYERAMVAERQNDLSTLEKNLTQLIQVRPNNPHAYNALGYTWADRGIRLDEAFDMIKKASDMAPNDPFIMDSLGWVFYKKNDLENAEITLQKAYAIRQDEEIGLHLIEVLIRRNKTDEAKTLSESLQTRFPKSDKLQHLLKTLTATTSAP
jgi:tetratricopeptide (TPR) repeat protein